MKKLKKIQWIIVLSVIVIVSLGVGISVYHTTYDIEIFRNIISKADIDFEINKHMLIYTGIQFVNIIGLLIFNIREYMKYFRYGVTFNTNFYGITNFIILVTILIVDVFKYQKVYTFSPIESMGNNIYVTISVSITFIVGIITFMILKSEDKKFKYVDSKSQEVYT